MIQMEIAENKRRGWDCAFHTLVSQQKEKRSQTCDKAHVSHALSMIDGR